MTIQLIANREALIGAHCMSDLLKSDGPRFAAPISLSEFNQSVISCRPIPSCTGRASSIASLQPSGPVDDTNELGVRRSGAARVSLRDTAVIQR